MDKVCKSCDILSSCFAFYCLKYSKTFCVNGFLSIIVLPYNLKEMVFHMEQNTAVVHQVIIQLNYNSFIRKGAQFLILKENCQLCVNGIKYIINSFAVLCFFEGMSEQTPLLFTNHYYYGCVWSKH